MYVVNVQHDKDQFSRTVFSSKQAVIVRGQIRLIERHFSASQACFVIRAEVTDPKCHLRLSELLRNFWNCCIDLEWTCKGDCDLVPLERMALLWLVGRKSSPWPPRRACGVAMHAVWVRQGSGCGGNLRLFWWLYLVSNPTQREISNRSIQHPCMVNLGVAYDPFPFLPA